MNQHFGRKNNHHCLSLLLFKRYKFPYSIKQCIFSHNCADALAQYNSLNTQTQNKEKQTEKKTFKAKKVQNVTLFFGL